MEFITHPTAGSKAGLPPRVSADRLRAFDAGPFVTIELSSALGDRQVFRLDLRQQLALSQALSDAWVQGEKERRLRVAGMPVDPDEYHMAQFVD
jgi:hypothetical protein